MKGGPRTSIEKTRARLLDLWRGEDSFGRPLGCVTTSFTFDPGLFEEQCLARFLSIQSNPNEAAKAYLVEREEKLSQCFACVLVDRAHSASNRSLRWNLLPVALPRGGVLHAKLTILVWENCIRVLIGSANLTEPGYRRNQEVVAALDFGPDANPSPELLAQCVAFLNQVRAFAPGADRTENGPQVALANFLRSIEKRVRLMRSAYQNEAECALVPLVPGGTSVVNQLSKLWKGPAPDRAWVISPFYDEEQQVGDTAAAFATLLTTRGRRYLSFAAPGRTLPGGKVEIDLPEALKRTSHSLLTHEFSFVDQRVENDGKEENRALHAKMIWLERGQRTLYMIGSSNFTGAGLGLHPAHNIELNVAYIIKDSASQFGKLCSQSWPREIAIDNPDEAQFFTDGMIDSAGNLDLPVLPQAFGLALFSPGVQGEQLELEIGGNAPQTFEVQSKDGKLLIDSASWNRDGKQTVSFIPWGAKRPPSSLEVRWRNKNNEELLAQWVVNISDMAALPAPDELGNLSLAELMEILTSARPLHEVVSRILERREKAASDAHAVVDPHKKVDTSQYLLRRMRRVAQALEGMRERLQQPVGSIEALRWRLRGPIGPIALARRLAEEDQDGAAFMIAEVAATLRQVEWQQRGSLDARGIKADVAAAMQVLRELAIKAPAPANLAKYVGTVFEELLP